MLIIASLSPTFDDNAGWHASFLVIVSSGPRRLCSGFGQAVKHCHRRPTRGSETRAREKTCFDHRNVRQSSVVQQRRNREEAVGTWRYLPGLR